MKLKKNAFRFPKDSEAVFPQAAAPVYIDKRTLAAPREFLYKDHQGTKMKNLIKKENQANLNKLLRQAELRGEGKEREDEVIEMEMLQDDDIEEGNLNFEKVKVSDRKKRNDAMDLDLDDNNINRTKRRRNKRETKSHKIVNY